MKGKNLYPEIKIKKLGIKYLDHCIKLDKETLNGIWTKRQWQDELTSAKRICLGALHQTKLIGLTSGWLATDEINITFVGVHPLFQNQGIASLMVLSLLSRSKEIGISIATLEVKENNLAAKSLYENLNFHQIGFRNKLYKDGSNAVIYKYIYN